MDLPAFDSKSTLPANRHENGVWYFTFGDYEVRAILDEETQEPWFVAGEVAAALGYKHPKNAVQDHCKSPKLFKVDKVPTLTVSPYGVTLIPESDVYRLILRSNLPSAIEFQDWVTKEVLPSIRKHGAYMTPTTIEELILNPDSGIALLTALKAEQQKARALTIQLEEAKPAVKIGQGVTDQMQGIYFQNLARVLGGIRGIGGLRTLWIGCSSDSVTGHCYRAQKRVGGLIEPPSGHHDRATWGV